MDQKPMRWHHCDVLRKHNILSFESFIDFNYLKLVFKCLNNHVIPVFKKKNVHMDFPFVCQKDEQGAQLCKVMEEETGLV